MKHIIFYVLLVVSIVATTAQEKEHSRLMVADTTWGIEKFSIPTGFAQEMTYNGFEEAFFPKGWGIVDGPEFWSYIFTWSLKADAPLTENDFETNLEMYFDGVLNISQKDTTVTKLPTTVLLVETKNVNNNTNYTGRLRIFDRFRTNKMMTLNLLAEQKYCDVEKQSVIVFRFSPKPLDHVVWNKLKTLVLREDVCTIIAH